MGWISAWLIILETNKSISTDIYFSTFASFLSKFIFGKEIFIRVFPDNLFIVFGVGA